MDIEAIIQTMLAQGEARTKNRRDAWAGLLVRNQEQTTNASNATGANRTAESGGAGSSGTGSVADVSVATSTDGSLPK
jgi:hypothetical protein